MAELFSKVFFPFYIPISTTQEFQFLCALANILYDQFLKF